MSQKLLDTKGFLGKQMVEIVLLYRAHGLENGTHSTYHLDKKAAELEVELHSDGGKGSCAQIITLFGVKIGEHVFELQPGPETEIMDSKEIRNIAQKRKPQRDRMYHRGSC